MADTTGFEPRPDNIEDRRKEFSAYQHLLMQLGLEAMDNSEPGKLGIPPGSYNTHDNPIRPVQNNKLDRGLGISDVLEMSIAQNTGQSLDPWLKPGGDAIGRYIALDPQPLDRAKVFPPIGGDLQRHQERLPHADLPPVEVIEPSDNEAKTPRKKKKEKK